MLGNRLTHNSISAIRKSRDKVSNFQLICFSSGRTPGFRSPDQCSQESGTALPPTEATEPVLQKPSAADKELQYRPADFNSEEMRFSRAVPRSSPPAGEALLPGAARPLSPGEAPTATRVQPRARRWQPTSPALTLPSVAARSPAQGQGGGGARRGDGGQEGAGVQRRSAPAGPGQHVRVQPHGPVQGLPRLPQQLQRRSHGAQAVPGHGRRHRRLPGGPRCRAVTSPAEENPGIPPRTARPPLTAPALAPLPLRPD